VSTIFPTKVMPCFGHPRSKSGMGGYTLKILKTSGLVLATLASAAMAPASAHESRLIPATSGSGYIRLTVGFSGEPAFEDTYNGVDVILNTYDSACTETPRGYFGAPIDPSGTASKPEPDKVDLKVEALYLKKAQAPTGPLGSIPPDGILKRLVLTDKEPLGPKFNTPGTFNSYFRPTHPGVYGFHIYGTVFAGPNVSKNCAGHTAEVPLAKRTASFNVYFICSAAGSFTPPGAFNCIEVAQTFPGGPSAAYRPDKELGSWHGALTD
jgi:hypothetical protein